MRSETAAEPENSRVGREDWPSRERTATEIECPMKTRWMAEAEGEQEEQRGKKRSCSFKVEEKRKLLLRSGLIKSNISESL